MAGFTGPGQLHLNGLHQLTRQVPELAGRRILQGICELSPRQSSREADRRALSAPVSIHLRLLRAGEQSRARCAASPSTGHSDL